MSEGPDEPTPARARTLRLAALWSAVVLAGLLGIAVTLLGRDTGEVGYRGRVLRVPLAFGSIKTSAADGRATYVMVADPAMIELFARRGAALGWGPADQLGSGIVVPSAAHANLQLIIVMEHRTRFFTEVRYRVAEKPP